MNKPTGKIVAIIIGVVVVLLLCCAVSSYFIYKNISSSSTDSNSSSSTSTEIDSDISSDSMPDETTSDLFDFNDAQNSGAIWTGTMTVARGTTEKQMHATYTFKFSYDLEDPSRTITSVRVTDISAESNLPADRVIILPYAHVSRGEYGGSVPSTAQFEDWNTYGYVYVSDYANLQSLGSTYQPALCVEDKYCDYLDEVGGKGGEIALRFKYVGLGSPTTEQPSFETQNVINAFDISPSQLSGAYSWQLNITLDDGTVETKEYVVEVDGSELDLASSNTSFVQF